MAKERAERQRGQSTHAQGLSCPGISVSSSLSALRTKAEKAPKHRFRDLFGLIDQQRLCEAYHLLKKRAAPGIDGVTHAEYGENLTENLRDLETRLREGRYRAQHVKRQWIAKAGSTKMRPLGIPVLEDKIVQQAVRMILEPIWEADFCDESIGYRPGRQARQSTLDLGVALDSGVYRWVVEADIKGFFDHIDHDWLCRMLEERIDDPRLIRLIRKWLKAGVLEDGRVTRSEEGTPQGGVISPLLANIYLHFVQDLWIRKVIAKESRGRVLFRRYADDSIVCFERKEDAERYLRKLPGRLAKFKLELAEGKTALAKFNRWEPETSGKFTFLGFDFYWKGTRKNPLHRIVRRRTTAKKFRASLQAMKEWLIKRPQPPAAGHRRHAGTQAARLLELLRSDRELGAPHALWTRGQRPRVQMAEPEESAEKLHLAGLHGCLGKLEAAPAASSPKPRRQGPLDNAPHSMHDRIHHEPTSPCRRSTCASL